MVFYAVCVAMSHLQYMLFVSLATVYASFSPGNRPKKKCHAHAKIPRIQSKLSQHPLLGHICPRIEGPPSAGRILV